MIARMESDYQAARLLWMRAGWLKNVGRRNARTGLAKWFATVASERAAGDAVQVHAPTATRTNAVGRFYRNCKRRHQRRTREIHAVMQADYLGYRADKPTRCELPMPEIRRVRICRPGDRSVAAEWLRDGGIVAFPTDTFYGLAVDPASAAAVRRLFALKGREARAALPLVAASTRQVETLCGRLGSTDARLAARFWPGPLSLIFDAPAGIAPEAHAGRRSIAIRVPGHAVARSLCEAFGAPVTATSANRAGGRPRGRPAISAVSPTTRACSSWMAARAGGAHPRSWIRAAIGRCSCATAPSAGSAC
jgi:tRNA threonylcarbamoyl adenosine modification protein (Sua5/YciO/YrdC/YwlC family)